MLSASAARFDPATIYKLVFWEFTGANRAKIDAYMMKEFDLDISNKPLSLLMSHSNVSEKVHAALTDANLDFKFQGSRFKNHENFAEHMKGAVMFYDFETVKEKLSPELLTGGVKFKLEQRSSSRPAHMCTNFIPDFAYLANVDFDLILEWKEKNMKQDNTKVKRQRTDVRFALEPRTLLTPFLR